MVRSDNEEANKLFELFNEKLGPEGYQIVQKTTRFGNVRYEAVGVLPEMRAQFIWQTGTLYT